MTPARKQRLLSFGLPISLAALVCVAFGRSLTAAPIWDDEYLTVRNPNLASWRGVMKLVSSDIWSSSALEEKSGYYRPFASLTYALNRLLLGNSAMSYHAGNVALHAAASMMLFRFITARKIAAPTIALPIVSLVATLPLAAEPVSWLAGRYDVLGSALALLTLLVNGGRARGWATPLCYALALLSKEPFAVVAGLVLLDDVLVLGRKPAGEALKYVGLVTAFAACLVLRHFANVPQPQALLEQGGLGALVRAYVFAWETFARLAVWPHDLCFFHTYVPATTAATVFVIVVLIAALGTSAQAWARARALPSRGGILMGALWCAGAMLPGSLTAPTLHIIGDRYAYFPFMGLAVCLAGLVPQRRWAAVGVWALLLLQLPRLESRLGELQSPASMYRATLARDPDNFMALDLWGNILAQRGDYAEAEAIFEHARQVAPAMEESDTGLCFVHLREHRYAEAEQDGLRAVADNRQKPRAWLNLASALVNEHEPRRAAEAASRALALRPHYAEALFVRALARIQLEDFDGAHEDLQAALRVDPNHTQARTLLERFHRH